jgi:hypothetical protein
VVLEMQNGFIARKKYFNELTVDYLKEKHASGAKWDAVAADADRFLDSLIPL